MNIGEKLKQERKKKGLTQGQLGELTSLTYQTILNMEANRGILIRNLQKVCKVLGIEIVLN